MKMTLVQMSWALLRAASCGSCLQETGCGAGGLITVMVGS